MASPSPGDVIAIGTIAVKLFTTIVRVIDILRDLPNSPERHDVISYLQNVLEQLRSLKDPSSNFLDLEVQRRLYDSIEAAKEIVEKFLDKVALTKTSTRGVWQHVSRFVRIFVLQYNWKKEVPELKREVSWHMDLINNILQKANHDLLTMSIIQQNATHDLVKAGSFHVTQLGTKQEMSAMVTKAFQKLKKGVPDRHMVKSADRRSPRTWRNPRVAPNPRQDVHAGLIHGTIKGGLENAEILVSKLFSRSSPFSINQRPIEEDLVLGGPSRTQSHLIDSFEIKFTQGYLLNVDSNSRNNETTSPLVNEDAVEKAAVPPLVPQNEELITADNVWDYLSDPIPSHSRLDSPSLDSIIISSEVPSMDWEAVHQDDDEGPEAWRFMHQIQQHEREQEERLQLVSPDNINVETGDETRLNQDVGGDDDEAIEDIPTHAAGCTHAGDIQVWVSLVGLVFWTHVYRWFKCKTCGKVVSRSETSTLLNVLDRGVAFNWDHCPFPGATGAWGTVTHDSDLQEILRNA